MRKLELDLNVENTNKWGMCHTSIGGIYIECYFDLRDGVLELTQFQIGEQVLPTYLVPHKIYNYMHDMVSEEL